MTSIPKEDVFIPEACKDCSPKEKTTYDEWISNILISELNYQNISYVLPSRHFPPNGDLRKNINIAVRNCTFTICCLCPAIANDFYHNLLEASKHKLILLDIGIDVAQWSTWRDWNIQDIPFSNVHQIQAGVRRIKQSLQTDMNIRPMLEHSESTGTKISTNIADDIPRSSTRHSVPAPQQRPVQPQVPLRKKSASHNDTLPCRNSDSESESSGSSIDPVNLINPSQKQSDRISVQSNFSLSTNDESSVKSFSPVGSDFNPHVPQQTSNSVDTDAMTQQSNTEDMGRFHCKATENTRFIKTSNMMVLEEIENTNPAGGRSATEFFQLLIENTEELQVHYNSQYISKYAIPYAYNEKRLAELAKLFAWSHDYFIKLHCLEMMKKLLTENTSVTDKKFGTHLITVERVLRPRKGDTTVKDMTIVMLYFEVYRLVISLLYLAIVSTSVSLEQVKDVLDSRLEIRDALAFLAKDYQTLYHINSAHVQAHTYVIGKFFTEALVNAVAGQSAKKKRSDLTTLIDQLDVLKGKNIPKPRREEIEKDAESIIKRCLSSKFLRHVFFHYLVILVCMQPLLIHLLDLLSKSIVDTESGILWSDLSLLYGYCTLCELCDNEAVISVVTDKDRQFKKTIQKCRQQEDKRNIVTEIVRSLLYHPSHKVSKVVLLSFQHDADEVLLPRAQVCIVEASRSTIRKQGSMLGLTLEPEQLSIAGLGDKSCVLLKGKLNHNRRVYCKFPKLTTVSDINNMSKVSETNSMLRNEILMLNQLQMNDDSPNVIKLLAYDAMENTQLPYLIYSCGNPEQSLSEYLVRSVHHSVEVSLQQRVGLAVDILNAVDFCNKQKILVRHICAHAFIVTSKHGQMVAKLANFKQAKANGFDKTLQYHGSKGEEIAVAWTAPESIFKSEYTSKTEVFSASQAVHEVLSHGIHPYQELGNIPLSKKYKQILKYRIWPERRPGEPESMFAALMEAFLFNPELRPSMDELLGNFRTFQKELHRASGRTLQRMSAHEMMLLELGRMITGQKIEPEMCSLFDMKDVTLHKDMWETPDEMETLYDAYSAGDGHIVACEEKELLAIDDPVLFPGKHTDTMFRSLMLKEISEEEKQELRQLKHPNVATVVRFIMENDSKFYMLMDCKSRLSLLDLMIDSDDNGNHISFYEQIADGMAYLHARHFIHGCLQAKYIYITYDDRAIIGQLARATLVHIDVYDDDVSQVMEKPFENPPINTIRWLPKETNESGFMTQKSDAHSFGVLIWEAENALNQPKDTLHSYLAPYCHVKYKQVIEVQRQRHTLPQPPNCPDWLHELIKALMANPSCLRPSFPEVLQCLRNRNSYKTEVETRTSAQNATLTQTKLKRLTMMVDKEEESMGFQQRGTIYFRPRRPTVFATHNQGYMTQDRRARNTSFNVQPPSLWSSLDETRQADEDQARHPNQGYDNNIRVSHLRQNRHVTHDRNASRVHFVQHNAVFDGSHTSLPRYPAGHDGLPNSQEDRPSRHDSRQASQRTPSGSNADYDTLGEVEPTNVYECIHSYTSVNDNNNNL